MQVRARGENGVPRDLSGWSAASAVACNDRSVAGISERLRHAESARYVKQGQGGSWAPESIERGLIQLGFVELPVDECDAARRGLVPWDGLARFLRPPTYKDPADAIRQVRLFYEAGPDTIWFTFHKRRLWWCFAHSEIESDASELSEGASRYRRVDGAWSDRALSSGTALWIASITGKLTAKAGYPKTLAALHKDDVRRLRDKILGQPSREAQAVAERRDFLVKTLEEAIDTLNDRDFEVLADLVLSGAGLRRSTPIGETQKTIDFEGGTLFSDQVVHVQVKAAVAKHAKDESELIQELAGVGDAGGRAILVANVLSEEFGEPGRGVLLVDRRDLAKYCVDYGLVDWVIDKAG